MFLQKWSKVSKLTSYVRDTDTLEISSDQSPSQKENRESCYRKLDDTLEQIANDAVARAALKDQATASQKEKKGTASYVCSAGMGFSASCMLTYFTLSIANVPRREWNKMTTEERKAYKRCLSSRSSEYFNARDE